jgi:hypothetical protein
VTCVASSVAGAVLLLFIKGKIRSQVFVTSSPERFANALPPLRRTPSQGSPVFPRDGVVLARQDADLKRGTRWSGLDRLGPLLVRLGPHTSRPWLHL